MSRAWHCLPIKKFVTIYFFEKYVTAWIGRGADLPCGIYTYSTGQA